MDAGRCVYFGPWNAAAQELLSKYLPASHLLSAGGNAEQPRDAPKKAVKKAEEKKADRVRGGARCPALRCPACCACPAHPPRSAASVAHRARAPPVPRPVRSPPTPAARPSSTLPLCPWAALSSSSAGRPAGGSSASPSSSSSPPRPRARWPTTSSAGGLATTTAPTRPPATSSFAAVASTSSSTASWASSASPSSCSSAAGSSTSGRSARPSACTPSPSTACSSPPSASSSRCVRGWEALCAAARAGRSASAGCRCLPATSLPPASPCSNPASPRPRLPQTPVGDLLVSFTKDQNTMDEALPDALYYAGIYSLILLATTITVSVT